MNTVTAIQKYSTAPPTIFIALHVFNTVIAPLATRSVPASESYLLLTRPVYQSPYLEHAVLTVPIVSHVLSGLALRSIRAVRRARFYGAEPGYRRYLYNLWPAVSRQAQLGYLLAPLLGTHVLVNRVAPVIVDGGSSGVGLGYVAHGIARRPLFWNLFYPVFVAAGVWHFVGGCAAWMGWRVTTARRERGTSRKGSVRYPNGDLRIRRQRRRWWVVNGLAALGASLWLAGGLGITGRAGLGAGWEAKSWNEIYRQVPILGVWL